MAIMNHARFLACSVPHIVHGRPCTMLSTWQARRDCTPHHPDLESGALSVRATGLSRRQTVAGRVWIKTWNSLLLSTLYFPYSLCLFMNRVLVAETAEFLKLQFIRSVPLIFYCRIISSLALCA